MLPVAYSPQLGAKLGITHTQLNIVGLAGNGTCSPFYLWPLLFNEIFVVGVYSSGPIWGRIIDLRGPRIPLTGAFLCLLGGYSGIRYLYNSGLPSGANTISTLTFCALIAFGFMTGAGGNGGLVSAVNSTAKTFPDQAVS